MLLKGGNAVDAVLATAITLTVVEPTSNGIGSDAFCILWDGKKLHGLNASGRSPAEAECPRLHCAPGSAVTAFLRPAAQWVVDGFTRTWT